MSRANDQRGFTLLELMIVVAVIAVLAAVAVPSWISDSRHGKYDPEISAMFAEISSKEEAYKSELGNGSYLTTASCPAATSQTGQDFNALCSTPAGAWNTLRVNASDSKIRCTYVVTTGLAGSVPGVPVGITAAPATMVSGWYFIYATCDMDGKGGVNATFFQSSWDTSVQKLNYGQ